MGCEVKSEKLAISTKIFQLIKENLNTGITTAKLDT